MDGRGWGEERSTCVTSRKAPTLGVGRALPGDACRRKRAGAVREVRMRGCVVTKDKKGDRQLQKEEVVGCVKHC